MRTRPPWHLDLTYYVANSKAALPSLMPSPNQTRGQALACRLHCSITVAGETILQCNQSVLGHLAGVLEPIRRPAHGGTPWLQRSDMGSATFFSGPTKFNGAAG